MDLEKNIQQLFSNDQSDIDADKFLNRLHHTRAIKHRNKQRLTYGLSTIAVVLFVIVLSITQITTDRMNYNSDYFISSGELSDEMQQQYYEELMIYLASESDDVWSTMELYYETSNQNLNGE